MINHIANLFQKQSSLQLFRGYFVSVGLLFVTVVIGASLLSCENLNTVENEDDATIKLKATKLQNKARAFFRQGKPDSALVYGREALNITLVNDKEQYAPIGLNTIGVIHLYSTKMDSASYYFQKAKDIGEKYGIEKYEKSAIANLAILESRQGNYDKALEYYQLSLNDKEQKSLLKGYNNIGTLYSRMGEFDSSGVYLFKALDIAKETNDSLYQINILINLGLVFRDIKAFDKAEDKYLTAITLAKSLNHKRALANSYNNLGTIYNKKLEYDKAIEYFNKSLDLKRLMKDSLRIATSLGNLAATYHRIKKLKKAKEYLNEAIDIQKNVGDLKHLTASYNVLSDINLSDRNFKESLRLVNKSIEIAENIKSQNDIAKGNLLKTKILLTKNASSDALDYLYTYDTLQQRLISEENRVLINRLEVKANKKEDQRKIEEQKNLILKTENEKLAFQKYLYAALLIVLMLCGIAYWNYSRKKIEREQNKLLNYQIKELENSNIQLVDDINLYKNQSKGSLSSNYFDRIFYLTPDKSVFVKLKNIVFLEKDDQLLKVFLLDGKTLTSWQSLKAIKSVLINPYFIQTHKSFLVNSSHVELLNGKQRKVILKNGKDIPISYRRKIEVQKYYEEFNELIVQNNSL